MGIPDAIGNLIWDWIKKGIWAEWLKFLFLLVFSGMISYLVTDGGALILGDSELYAHGSGEIMAAGAMLVCFTVNGAKLFKGMAAIIPNQEVISALETQYHEVKPEEKK